jgi:pimeloyl-ACP methyl ester carboxylesterase
MNIIKKSFFQSHSGFKLDVKISVPENPASALAVWPCMGGAVQMYRLPVDRFNSIGCACIQYNPRGHGRSDGEMAIEESFTDLDDILSENIPSGIPLIMVCHSAGANAALQFGKLYRAPRAYLMVAPVLDSRESLFYMYQRNTIREFIDILSSFSEDDSVIRKVLSDDKWLSADIWKKNNYRDILNRIHSRMQIGTFLENLFIPGHNAFRELAYFKDCSSILIARDDTWYPADTIRKLANENNIDVCTVEEAENHFFAGGWDRVWDEAFKIVASGKFVL